MISVLMSTYREADNILQEAVDSILRQTCRDLEFIILCDDPGNTHTQRILENYAKQDSRIRFYINEQNLGLTASLNKGLKLARGEYIARMDADDISLAHRLENQQAYLENNGYDLIGSRMMMIDENGNEIYSIQKVPTDAQRIQKCLKYGTCLAHPTWFGRREVFEKLHGYRDVPFCEDSDFVLRAQLAGFRLSNVDEILVKYRMTKASQSRSNLYDQYLNMTYITSAYRQGRTADLEQCDAFVNRRKSEKRAKRFSKANVLFNQMLNDKRKKQYFRLIKHGLQLVFTSGSYVKKIWRFVMLDVNSR